MKNPNPEAKVRTIHKGRAVGPTLPPSLAGPPIIDEASKLEEAEVVDGVLGESAGVASKMQPNETKAFDVEFDSPEGLRKSAEAIAEQTGIDVEVLVGKLEALKASVETRGRAAKGLDHARDAFLKLSVQSPKRIVGGNRKDRRRRGVKPAIPKWLATKVPAGKKKAKRDDRNKNARLARRRGRK